MTEEKLSENVGVKKQAVLILGMHRSGTSTVSRALNILGYNVGDNLMSATEDNVKGYWEDVDIVAYNDSLLTELSSSWDLPLVTQSTEDKGALFASHQDDGRSLINKKFLKFSRIAIKDPRISMLFHFWSKQLNDQGFDVKVILCLRHPQAVADSLNRRDGFSDEKSYQLWLQHNLSVLSSVKKDFLVVNYNAVLKRPEHEIGRIGKFLGLDKQYLSSDATVKAIEGYCTDFIDSALSHVDESAEQRYNNAPEYIDYLYKKLMAFSNKPVMDKEDSKKLLASLADMKAQLLSDQNTVLIDEVISREKTLIKVANEVSVIQQQLQQAENIRNFTAKENLALKDGNCALKEADGSLKEANGALKEANGALKEANGALKEANGAFNDANGLLKKNDVLKESELVNNQAKITELSVLLDQSNQQSHNLQQQIEAWAHTVDAIHASTSWRLTYSLRWLAGSESKIQLAMANTLKFLKQRGLRTTITNARYIYRTEGVLGLKRRLSFGPRELLAVVPVMSSTDLPNTMDFDFPVSIVRNRSGEYSIENVPADYTYITPRKPKTTELMQPVPMFSILVPTYNTDIELLDKMIASVESQWYSHWQLILVDDASPSVDTCNYLAKLNHPAIKIIQLDKNRGIAGATNAALEAATGDYVVLLDHDDELTVDCLYELALKIDGEAPDFIYSDEDKISPEGDFTQPHFKPDWSPDTMMSTMYTCHVACFKRQLLNEVGGLRSEYDGCQDWDLVLRVTEKTNHIAHIAKVLYHWRIIPESIASNLAAKPYVMEATQKVRLDAMVRRGIAGSIEPVSQVPGYFRVKYHLQGQPLISIIIPTRDNESVLRCCIESIFTITEYKNFEIIILDNGSADSSTLKYLEQLNVQNKVNVIRHDAPFNYSELNNLGVARALGSLYLFLNDDTEILQPGWLEELGGYAQLPHVGAVGAKLLYPQSNNNQHAGILNLEDGPGHAFLNIDADFPGYYMRNLLEYNWLAVTGACLMVDATKYKQVSGFDESFPIAYNDVDLCMRLFKEGFYNVVCQSIRLIHHESVSRGVDNVDPIKMQRLENDRKRLYREHPEYFQSDPFYNSNLHPNGINFEAQQ